MSDAEKFKSQLREFFAFSGQDKWTRRQIADRIDREFVKFSKPVEVKSDTQLQSE